MGRVEAKVTLIAKTPDAEGLVASAARLCYATGTEGLFDKNTKRAAMIRRLRRIGHLSPLEHAGFSFHIEGVSRAMTHQLVRHRLASYSQRSQRYVAHDGFNYVVPPQMIGKRVVVDGKPREAGEYFAETMSLLAERYARLNEALGDSGEQSNEDARYVLPNACETRIAVTMNARELLHFFEERLCQRAQWEIRLVAEKMLSLVKTSCPALFAGSGPKCVRMGRCPEGKMGCGQYGEMCARYAERKDESDAETAR
jgi:thymidylate synthase (FAD)